MIPAHAALLVVDVQRGLDDPKYGRRSNPDAEANIARLLAAWRAAGWPVVHVQHLSTAPDSPLRPDLPGVAIKPEAAPREGEPLFQKRANGAFIGTDLEPYLRARGITALPRTLDPSRLPLPPRAGDHRAAPHARSVQAHPTSARGGSPPSSSSG